MDYLIDVSDSRIQAALAALNIKQEDLKLKTFESFAGEDISQDIQEIRYNHYISKSNGQVKQINDYLQKLEDLEQDSAPCPPPHKLTVDIMKEKHDLRLLKFFEAEKTSRILEKELRKKNNRDKKVESKLQSNQEEIRKKKEQILNKHQEKLKKIIDQRKQQQEIILEKINRTTLSPKKNKSGLKERKVFSLTCDEQDIESKLQEFNRKLLKSSENYTRNLIEKVETMKRYNRRRNTTEGGDEYEVKVLMFNDKLNSAVSRRKKIQSQLRERIHESRFLKYEKLRKGTDHAEEFREVTQSESEEKIEKIMVSIKSKKKELNEGKVERLKNLEANIHEKIQNMKKVELMRKEKILEKHLQINKKHQEYKQSLEIANKTIRTKAMNFTIEKEKALAIKCQVAKSQSPEDLERLLEKYKTCL